MASKNNANNAETTAVVEQQIGYVQLADPSVIIKWTRNRIPW